MQAASYKKKPAKAPVPQLQPEPVNPSAAQNSMMPQNTVVPQNPGMPQDAHVPQPSVFQQLPTTQPFPIVPQPAQPQVVEHRQTVTIQATHYMMQEMKRTNELLELISRKLTFFVDQLS